jgi:4-hydroxy-3-polyprenylbenzoate decarboxylase
MPEFVVAMTGASGSVYALRLLEVLMAAGCNVHLTISPAAVQVFRQEVGGSIDLERFDISQLFPAGRDAGSDPKLEQIRGGSADEHVLSSVLIDSAISQGGVHYHHYRDFSAGIASGSFLTDGMVICPCSMGTLASIAHGLSSNLIQRAADVHLKERRKLILVPRETPLGSIQLENMKRLADAGSVILPAMPAFYHQPVTIHDMIDFVVGRICDQLGIRHELFQRWGTGHG